MEIEQEREFIEKHMLEAYTTIKKDLLEANKLIDEIKRMVVEQDKDEKELKLLKTTFSYSEEMKKIIDKHNKGDYSNELKRTKTKGIFIIKTFECTLRFIESEARTRGINLS